MRTVRSMVGGRAWAAILSGSLVGILIFAVAMIWRGARGETLVLQVMPVDDPNIVRVYVGGEVVVPGLYTLPRGSRVSEALQAAGGTTPLGELAGIGMASIVQDADQIIVPARVARSTPERSTPVPPVAGASVPTPPTTTPGPLNINTATAEELEALPGIGPAISALIVEYRTVNGPFQTVDELEAISGISQRMVDEMRHRITVGP